MKALKSVLKKLSKEPRDYLLNFLTQTPIPLLVLDDKFSIIAATQEFVRRTKHSLTHLSSSNLKDISPESFSAIKKACSRLPAQDKSEIKRILILGKDKAEFNASASISLYRNSSNTFYFLFLPRLEVVGNELLLKDSSRFDDYLYSITQRGKWLLNTNKRIFYGNQVSNSLLGLNPKLTSIPWLDVLNLFSSREEQENFEKDLIQLGKSPEIIKREVRLRIQNGDNEAISRYVRFTFSKAELTDEDYVVGVMDDITEYKSIERELFRSRSRVEKADRFKSVFLSNLSHEIRTPMNAIMGYSELLNQAGLDAEEMKSYTEIVRAKGNYLLTLIDDVIELARFESGNIEFSYSEFPLLPILKELYHEFDNRRISQGKNAINIILDVPEDAEEQMIFTDYGRLQQLLSNLLSNALKFTERGEVSFGYKISSKNFKFFVSDTGVGLSPEDQKRVFNRFEILEDIAMRRLSGTGLSLTISKHIVEQLGGKIKVRSEENKGSRFQLNLPVLKKSKRISGSEKESEIHLSHNWKDKVILVAEDEDVNYRFLEAILQKTQAQVLRARNGQEAIDLCRTISQIDMVLMDIKMPVMNGYDAIIEIKRYRTNLPIIIQTAYSSPEEIEKSQQLGCDDYITKPIDINSMIEKINKQFLN